MNENMKQKLIISPERILRKLEFRPNFDIYNLVRNISIISVENPFFFIYMYIFRANPKFANKNRKFRLFRIRFRR